MPPRLRRGFVFLRQQANGKTLGGKEKPLRGAGAGCRFLLATPQKASHLRPLRRSSDSSTCGIGPKKRVQAEIVSRRRCDIFVATRCKFQVVFVSTLCLVSALAEVHPLCLREC